MSNGIFARRIPENIEDWDTSAVTSMISTVSGGGLDEDINNVNRNIGRWMTANVADMTAVFNNNTYFNQDIGSWDTGNATSMAAMFKRAAAFNQDIGGWDTSRGVGMIGMFSGASAFDQDWGA